MSDMSELACFCQWCRCPIGESQQTAENGAAYFCSYVCVEAYENDIDEQEDEGGVA